MYRIVLSVVTVVTSTELCAVSCHSAVTSTECVLSVVTVVTSTECVLSVVTVRSQVQSCVLSVVTVTVTSTELCAVSCHSDGH